MAGPVESRSDLDVRMVDPFLDYITAILMEERIDDAAYMQHVYNGSYQAIFSSFSDILGEHEPPNCSGNASSQEGVFDPHLLHDSAHQNSPDEQDFKVACPNIGLIDEPHNTVGAPALSSPSKSTEFSELYKRRNGPHKLGSRLNSSSCGASLSSDKGMTAQSFGFLMDAMTSWWGDDAAVEGLIGYTRQEHCNDRSKPPSTDEFLSELAEAALSFEDLELDDVYTSLYIKRPSSDPARAAADSQHSEQNKKSLAGKGLKQCEKGTSDLPVFGDVREVLVTCAEAVGIGDVKRANKILQELHQVHAASPNGTGLQRIAHVFSEALAVRMRGQAGHESGAMSKSLPSTAMLLRASKVGFELNPLEKILYYFGNQSILKAAEGASRLHIVDYATMYGMQWPFLINALAKREGGPPLLVITAIEFSHPFVNMAERLDITGQRLTAYAKTCRVPFQFHAIVTNKWEDLDAASLRCHEGEALVVNCKRLRFLADDGLDSVSPVSARQKFFTGLHILKPHIVVTTVVNAAYSSPFFVSRFREALYFFSNVFDMVDTVWGDRPQRMILERSCFYGDIVNIVACEGAGRVERPEGYKQWHKRIAEAGFEQLTIPSTILSRSKWHVTHNHHKDFHIHDDANGWMLMGWKGRTLLATSVWKPCLLWRCNRGSHHAGRLESAGATLSNHQQVKY